MTNGDENQNGNCCNTGMFLVEAQEKARYYIKYDMRP